MTGSVNPRRAASRSVLDISQVLTETDLRTTEGDPQARHRSHRPALLMIGVRPCGTDETLVALTVQQADELWIEVQHGSSSRAVGVAWS
jgi:hypothetical protein